MAAASEPHFFLSFTIFIICTFVISLTEATKLGFTVELIHRDSPKSPFYNNATPPFQLVYNALRRSIKRVNHFYPNVKIDDDVESEIIAADGEYIMAYSLGTPPFQTYGLADTGSDLIWLQCMPCDQCFSQQAPLFDPLTSLTYRSPNCNSKRCKSVEPSVNQVYCDIFYACQYRISYGDNSVSNGNIAHDTLTLGTSSGGKVAFPQTVFGCGRRNVGLFSDQYSGIVGLARGPMSLVSQMGSSIEGKFSYCLVPSLSGKSGKLKFGQNAVVSGSGTVSTPIVSKQPEKFYYLTLEGMSVGDKRLDFIQGDDSIFNKKVVEEGNIIIDSGTTVTILPQDFYSKLESEVAAVVDPISDRVDDPTKQLSLCYLVESVEDVGAPSITAHFRGADVTLSDINTFIMVSSEVACLAFRPVSIVAIYGNVAQLNFLVGYDLQNNLVSFKPTDCTMP